MESPLIEPANAQQQKARIARVPPIAQRRPRRNLSRKGPIRGATIAKGSIVSRRNDATWPRASPDGTVKNSVPAKETATAASPAVLKARATGKRRPVAIMSRRFQSGECLMIVARSVNWL